MYRDKMQRDFARQLRRNVTDAERQLWGALRCEQLHGFKFRRQAAIGDFIFDFVCLAKKLVIELDGGQHNEASAKEYDNDRTAWLSAQGFRVLRFWNHEVFESFDEIVGVIWRTLESESDRTISCPSPALPTRGRE